MMKAIAPGMTVPSSLPGAPNSSALTSKGITTRALITTTNTAIAARVKAKVMRLSLMKLLSSSLP